MKRFQETSHRMESAAFCMLLGHQMGQWSERRRWGAACVELMSEGMNPRIAGLHAPSLLSACWMAWPVAIPEHLLSLFNEATMLEYERLAPEMTNLVQSRCNRFLETARHLGAVK